MLTVDTLHQRGQYGYQIDTRDQSSNSISHPDSSTLEMEGGMGEGDFIEFLVIDMVDELLSMQQEPRLIVTFRPFRVICLPSLFEWIFMTVMESVMGELFYYRSLCLYIFYQ